MGQWGKEMLMTRTKRSNWGIGRSVKADKRKKETMNMKKEFEEPSEIRKGRKDVSVQLGVSGVDGGRELLSLSDLVAKSCIPRPFLSRSCGGW